MKSKTLFIVAAGSGGHILPALTLARTWRKNNPDGSIIMFTGTTALERKIVQQTHELSRTYFLSLSKFSLRSWWKIPWIMTQCIRIFMQTFFVSLWYKPERVISTGGLLSIPVCLATRLTRRTTELYELNVIPGKATKALLPIVHTIHIVFEHTKKLCRWGCIDFTRKCILSTYPLRFAASDTLVNHDTIISQLKPLDPTLKTVFILGGSQGSRLLNTLTRSFINTLFENGKKINVIHQTGALEEAEWEGFYQEKNLPAITFSYNATIHNYYNAADLILCRAGAGTMFEILFFKKPCVVIPLIAQTTDHQEANAHAMAEKNPELFTVINQNEEATTVVSAMRGLLHL